jgi:hypothetical protein
VFQDAPGVTALGTTTEGPVVVLRPHGRGRIIVSGAMDAWRYRDASSVFESFWTQIVWDAAVAAGAPLRVTTDPIVATPGARVRIDAVLQQMSDVPGALTARAVLRCGDEESFVRLWPAARPGTFAGHFTASASGACRIDAAIGDQRGAAPLLVSSSFEPPLGPANRLDRLIEAHGGTMVSEHELGPLVAALRQKLPSTPDVRQWHPMRSTWWMAPFVLCLGTEWWLRRRAGQA